MANPLTNVQLNNALKKWFPNGGYEFVDAVGRPGTFLPRGFTVHHTGGAYTDSDSYLEFLFETGRPAEGIPAQLCQFAVGASGKLYIGDWNQRANHAGMGSSSTRTKIVSEDYPGYTSEIAPGPDDINGNPEYYGVEVMYPGTLPMKPAQYKTTVRLAAMIVDAHGWTALSVLAHREHTKRKWDPGQHPLDDFRRDVRDLLAAGPGGEDMPLNATDLAAIKTIVRAVVNNEAIPVQSPGVKAELEADGWSTTMTTRRMIEYMWSGVRGLSKPEGLLTKILAAASDDPEVPVILTPEQVTALGAYLAANLPDAGDAIREVLGSLDEEEVTPA